ncbi:MAG: J domain-containing protein, partial [Geminicoccaceae bacterium]
PGCDAEGRYRAPRSREELRNYRWLCLEHVREHNRRWDYFAGMSPEEIERHRRADVTWHRPSWRFGVRPADRYFATSFVDPHGILNGHGPRRATREEPRALVMMRRLGLEPGFTLDELKRRFKALAKRHHPDLNGGDRAAEARLREIIEAYRYLLDHRLHA